MKLYVIVDGNLSKSQQAVQSAHVVAQYLLENPKTTWKNGTLVLLKTKKLEDYYNLAESFFKEPDLRNKITAISFLEKNCSKRIELPLL